MFAKTNNVPFALRLAGLWLIWGAWCSCSGWLLSVLHQLNGRGHAALLPVLFFCWWRWLKVTTPSTIAVKRCRFSKFRRRMLRPAPLIFAVTVVLSLISGCLYQPWSSDAVLYRLPRLLYWWAENHWYWIGALDHRLDFSSCGFEWQMLPVIELTHSDRLLFLLSWIPFLFVPGLTFYAFKSLGVRGRNARRWMWLFPMAYCIVLQASGVQNDGYSINFLFAAIGFAAFAFKSGRVDGLLMSVLATALLSGAKLSNVPLLLPLGVVLLPALRRVNLFTWKTPAAILVAIMCSCAPMVFLSIKTTGDFAGDPKDQWHMRAQNPVGGLVANAVLFLNDAAQPPILPGAQRLTPIMEALDRKAAPLMDWLKQAHGHFGTPQFAEMAYEGTAGLGFSICIYTLFVMVGPWFIKRPKPDTDASTLPLAWRWMPWLAWFSYAIFLAKLSSPHTARIALPYYPLLLISIIRCPRIAAFERRKVAGWIAALAALAVVPVLILTPARPLIPAPLIAWMDTKPSLEKVAAKYQLWAGLRDDLAPLRDALPPGVTKLGYAGGFGDTSYGLWKPFGSRSVVELGLPPGSNVKPPADVPYAIVTQRGLGERYSMDLNAWCDFAGAEVVFEHKRNTTLDGHSAASYESWYLVKLRR